MEKKIGKYKIVDKSDSKSEFFQQFTVQDEIGQRFTMQIFLQKQELSKDNVKALTLLEKYIQGKNEYYLPLIDYFFYQEKLVCVLELIGPDLGQCILKEQVSLQTELQILWIWTRIFQGSKFLLNLYKDFSFISLQDIWFQSGQFKLCIQLDCILGLKSWVENITWENILFINPLFNQQSTPEQNLLYSLSIILFYLIYKHLPYHFRSTNKPINQLNLDNILSQICKQISEIKNLQFNHDEVDFCIKQFLHETLSLQTLPQLNLQYLLNNPLIDYYIGLENKKVSWYIPQSSNVKGLFQQELVIQTEQPKNSVSWIQKFISSIIQPDEKISTLSQTIHNAKKQAVKQESQEIKHLLQFLKNEEENLAKSKDLQTSQLTQQVPQKGQAWISDHSLQNPYQISSLINNIIERIILKQLVIKPLNQSLKSPQNYIIKYFLVKQICYEFYQLEYEHFLQQCPFGIKEQIWQEYLESKEFQQTMDKLRNYQLLAYEQMKKFYVKSYDLMEATNLQLSEEFKSKINNDILDSGEFVLQVLLSKYIIMVYNKALENNQQYIRTKYQQLYLLLNCIQLVQETGVFQSHQSSLDPIIDFKKILSSTNSEEISKQFNTTNLLQKLPLIMYELKSLKDLLLKNEEIKSDKVVIGVVPDWRYKEENEVSRVFYFEDSLRTFDSIIRKFNAQLYIIWYFDNLEQVGSQIEGLIIPGGWDIDPAQYNEQWQPQTQVAPEYKIWFKAIKRLYEQMLIQHKPVLGICWGMQFINVYHGGSLVQHICDQKQHLTKWKIHLKKTSQLYWLLGCFVYGCCFHHQLVKNCPQEIEIIGQDEYSKEIHAIRLWDESQFVIGVQWHPEATFVDEEQTILDEKNQRLFEYFIEKAKISKISN